MKREMISEILGNLDGRFIGEAAEAEVRGTASPARKRRIARPLAAVAACLVLAAVPAAVAACAAEEKEYRTAVTFFEENGLSAEGLDRAALKAVYRDIVTNSFTNGKTAEVIRRSVAGVELEGKEPTPEELAEAWNRKRIANSVPNAGFSYKYERLTVYDEERDLDVFEKSVVKCFRDGELLWTAEIPEFNVAGSRHSEAGTVLWGRSDAGPDGRGSVAFAALADDEGRIVWKTALQHSDQQMVATVLDNGDGSFAVIGRHYRSYLCLTILDGRGQESAFHMTRIGNYDIGNAARLGDGYLVQLVNFSDRTTAQICRIDREGNVTERYDYEAEDSEYYLTDMVEYAGRVCLSAYAVPKQTGKGVRKEIGSILDQLFPEPGAFRRTDSEGLVRLLRENYTAILLICDETGGAPRQFYSVKGALGGRLSVREGTLVWDVENLVNAKVSLQTSSHTIRGTCRVIRYEFDPAGNFIRKEETGELTGFYR